MKKLLGSDVSFLDYPPQPDPIAVRQRQFEVFSIINTYLAEHRVKLSKRQDKGKPPRIVLKSVCAVFWDKILLLLLLAVTVNILRSIQLLFIKWFIKSFSNDSKSSLWSIAYIAGILALLCFKTIMAQHMYFFICRCQAAISSAMSYTIFRLGVSRRKEYHNCNCGQRTYDKVSRRHLCKWDRLYLRRFEVQLEGPDDNLCKLGAHIAKQDRINTNTLCPAQQAQGDELSKSMYMFFYGDTRSICKMLQVLVALTEFSTQLALSYFSIYFEVGRDGTWAIAVPLAVLGIAIAIEFIYAYLMKKYLIARDSRVYASYKLCANVQSVLMQGLGQASKNFVAAKRREETKPLNRMLWLIYVAAWLSSVVQSLSIVPIFITLLYGEDSKFSPEVAVTVIHAVKLINSHMRELPNILCVFIDALICMDRLDSYLSERSPEKGPPAGGFCASHYGDHEFELAFDRATLRYTPGITPALKNISLKLVRGDVLILCGKAASGKTSLIKAALGELVLSSGTMAVSSLRCGRRIYYVPQKHYIPAGTFMSALVGNFPFERATYIRAISVAELCQDLERWEEGHDRAIDENANSLSGGQRARLSLARMIYAFLISRHKGTSNPAGTGGADLVCLDDVFSSLDLSVSVKIFQNIFGQHGVFSDGDVCVIMSMDRGTLKACWQMLCDFNSATLNCRVCELEDGEVVGFSSVEDFIGLDMSSSLQVSSQTPKGHGSKPIRSCLDPIDYDFNIKGVLTRRVLSMYMVYFRHSGVFSVTVAFLMSLIAYCIKSYFGLAVVGWSDQVLGRSVSKEQSIAFVSKLMIFLAVEIAALFIGIMLWWRCAMSAAKCYHDRRIISLIPRKGVVTKPIGKLLTEFTFDQFVIDTRIHMALLASLSQLVHLGFQIGSIIYIFPLSVLAFLIIAILSYYTIVGNYMRVNQRIQFNMLESMTGVNLTISQGIHGMELVRAFGDEGRLFDSFLDRSDYFYRTHIIRWGICSWTLIMYTLLAIIVFVLFAVVPMFISIFSSGQLAGRPGNFVYLISLFITINDGVSSFILSMGYLSEYLCSLVSSHTEAKVGPAGAGGPAEAGVPGEVGGCLLDIRGIVVSYRNHDPMSGKAALFKCIRGVTVSADPGDIVAIAGRTGSGKTSLLKSIRGMLGLDAGTILIDGISIEHMSDELLTDTIGVVSQFSFYFDGWTLGDFIDPCQRYSVQKVHWALGELGLLDFVLGNVPDKDESEESRLSRALGMPFRIGSSIVSKEHQRLRDDDVLIFNESHIRHLSFARLILGRLNYKVILIDEPPNLQNSLGSSPSTLRALIAKYLGHCATIIVTHDFNYVKICSKLWIMSEGKVVEQLSPKNIETHVQFSQIVEK